MTGRVICFDDPAHHAAEELLPWFVNGTLDGDDRASVEQHLGECTRCQHEVHSLREFQAAYVSSEISPDPAPSFEKLRGQLAGPKTRRRPLLLAHLNQLWQQAQRWTPWALAAQLMVIVVLGAMLVGEGGRTTLYRTLGAADARHPPGSLVVVFDPRTTEAELRQIVHATGARIVDGPTTADAYVLELPAARQAAVLEALRAQRAVVLAERLEGGH